MSYLSNLDVQRQRRAAIDKANAAASTAEHIVMMCAAGLMVFAFLGFLFCALFGATLAACYVFAFGFGGGAVVGLLSHAVRELVFTFKTWNV